MKKNDFENKFSKKGDHVRLKYGYVIRHDGVNKDGVVECCLYEETKGGKPVSQERDLELKKKPSIIHWVCQKTSQKIKVHHYDYLFYWWKGNEELLSGNHKDFFDKYSLITIPDTRIEQSANLSENKKEPVQFERLGYYTFDQKDNDFHRIVPLIKPDTDPYDVEDKLEKSFQEQKIFKYFGIYKNLKKSEMIEKGEIELKGNMPSYSIGFKPLQRHLEEHRKLLFLIEPWLSSLNQYIVIPHSYLIKKMINEETPLEAPKKSIKRINTLLTLLKLVAGSKGDLKNFFNKPEENQHFIQTESITELFKDFVEEKIINLANKIKSFSEKYDPKICTIKEIEAILEDFIIFIGRYYFIMSSMIYVHRGAFPEHTTLSDIKKMMPYFSKPEAWQPTPPDEWKVELIKKHIEPTIKRKLQK